MNQDIWVLIEHVRGKVADISYLMIAQARKVAEVTGGRVIAILLGNNSAELAKDLAVDSLWYVDHPALADFTWDGYLKVLEDLITQNIPRLMLFGDTTIGSEISSGLSARLGMALVGKCQSIQAMDATLKFTSRICGGKIIAEGELPAESVLVTMLPEGFKVDQGQSANPPDMVSLPAPELDGMRVLLKEFIEPPVGDVDITIEPILIAIGRGIEREDNLEVVEELAEVLGGVLCASRPVIDQKWLPVSRLVGKSGKTVKPKLYLAMGVSGAPEHTETIGGDGLIIAVNTDPTAPIFNLAKYGAMVDMLDLAEELTVKICAVKGA